MNDIERKLGDQESVSLNSADPPTGCPIGSPYDGFKILIASVTDLATTTQVTPTSLYAYVAANDEEIRSSVASIERLGEYEVKFYVGLSSEIDAEILRKSPEYSIQLNILLDQCSSALVPAPLQ